LFILSLSSLCYGVLLTIKWHDWSFYLKKLWELWVVRFKESVSSYLCYYCIMISKNYNQNFLKSLIEKEKRKRKKRAQSHIVRNYHLCYIFTICMPNMGQTFYGVTISSTKIVDVLVRNHVIQQSACHIVLLSCFDIILNH
jgi:hypothetical protein